LAAVQPVIEEICKTTGQVGLAYGVLYRGQVILAKGYGFRDSESQKPANEETLFNIASCTKAFTATACALLAKEGVIDMDAPVKTYLPELKEKEATLVDLLAHRTGYARLDMSWVGQRSEVLVSQADLITRVNALPRIGSLRSEWLYNNWMYAIAGVIIERTSKSTYLNFMRTRVIEHYGLKRSCIERQYVIDDNISLAYAASTSGTPMRIAQPPWEDSPFTPGGGIRSCVSDMLIWAQVLLRAYESEAKNGSAHSKDPAEEHPGMIFSPQMILPDSISYGQLERSYGMGFMRLMLPSALSYGGRNHTVADSVVLPPVGAPSDHKLVLSHAGENAGALSAFTLIPELDAAIVVLGNTTALGDANELVMHVLSNQILNPGAHLDYGELATRVSSQCKEWHNRVIKSPLREHQIQATSVGPLKDYLGVYVGFEYTMRVNMEDGALILHHGGRESQRAMLSHYHYETFSFATIDYDEHMRLAMIDYDNWRLMLVQFERDYTGSVVGIKWFLDVDIAPVLLERKA
jgi:CubicO group peptidase (beta-lactamase class C family)